MPLGVPFNLASYGLLLELVARETDLIPKELVCNMADCHVYLNQIEAAKVQMQREINDLPWLFISDNYIFPEYDPMNISLIDYIHSGLLKFPLSN